MELSSSFLVAMMFVVLVTMGIGNILMSLASMVDRRSPLTASRLHLSWIVLILLVYFRLFWHTLDFFSVEEWQFEGFLYVMLGPVLILFASQVLLPDPSHERGDDLDENYLNVSRPFFLFLAGSQLWVNGVDLLLGGGLTPAGAMNGLVAVLAIWLAFSRNRTVHVFVAAAVWLTVLSGLVLSGLGVFG